MGIKEAFAGRVAEIKAELERRRQVKLQEQKAYREAYDKARIGALKGAAKRRARESVKPDTFFAQKHYGGFNSVGNAIFGTMQQKGKRRRGFSII